MKLAVIETKKSRNDFKSLFVEVEDLELDVLYLCSDESVAKVLKKNVDLELNPDLYDYIILVGSEPMKFYLGSSGVINSSGTIFRDKFIPLISPGMLYFKPELKKNLEDSLKRIKDILTGKESVRAITDEIAFGITTKEAAMAYLAECWKHNVIAVDCETTALYHRNGYVQGISIAYCEEFGAYISSDCIDEDVEENMRALFKTRKIVFHNAKFDRAMLQFHFNFEFPDYDDTMLLHYMVNETPGTHGLKDLAAQHTPYGHYEEPLYDFINSTIKAKGIKKEEFYWGWIPFETMYPYAAMDSLVTLIFYNKIKPAVYSNPKFVWVYENLLRDGSSFLQDIQDVGVPFDRDRLEEAGNYMVTRIEGLKAELKADETVQAFEREEGHEFNPGSVLQLRKLLFDYKGMKPTGRVTGKGLDSTDKKALATLAKIDPLPQKILDIRQASKILNTYIVKIKLGLDSDSRLRTNFNLHSTTSGRLSSSGKLNMQQLPREEVRVKGCIKAKPGYKIVSMDLKTAEMYYAAVLSGDTVLMEVFSSGGDFHSSIAKQVFKLQCTVDKVKELFPLQRQAAKAVSFGILYGAGSAKIAETVTEELLNAAAKSGDYSNTYFSRTEADEAISDYFKAFPALAKWIKKNQQFIKDNGFIYSALGRKRRLTKAKELKDMGDVRSGLNFLIQSLASDINLLGAIQMHNVLKERVDIDAKIFALVHDSIVAEVREEDVDEYCKLLKACVQADRGVSIKNCPVGCDFDVSDDYSNGKYDEKITAFDEEVESDEDEEDLEIPF